MELIKFGKKIIFAFICCSFVLGLTTGCGSNKNTNNSNNAIEVEEKQKDNEEAARRAEEQSKNLLAVEGNELINAAKAAYQLNVLDGTIKSESACFNLDYLFKEGYYSKSSKEQYTGSVYINVENNDYYKTSYTVWISDGTYAVTGPTGLTGKDASTASSASNICDGNCTGNCKIFN